MSHIEYRLYFNNTPATREQLDRVEEIVVEQAVDMAWEARLKVPIGTDAQGEWTGEADSIFADFTPVRVELKVGDSGFVPLIDGPVVGRDDQTNTEPGQGMMTVVVQDDSVFLNREERLFRFDDQLDHEIAAALFEEIAQITETEIETTPAPTSQLTPAVAERGTAMTLLRSLARRQGLHAYVLPGTAPGESIGCFKAFTTEPSSLPPLRLTGPERNLAMFSPEIYAHFSPGVRDPPVLPPTHSVYSVKTLPSAPQALAISISKDQKPPLPTKPIPPPKFCRLAMVTQSIWTG